MRRFTSIFIKRDKRSDHSSSSSSTNSDNSTPSWKSWIGARRSSQKLEQQLPPPHDIDEDSPSDDDDDDDDEYDQNNIRIHIQNALALHPQPNSPFVLHPHQSIFPRSSNNSNILKTQSSTRTFMFNSHLLDRLNLSPLSPSELSSILPFASKSAPSPIIHPVLPSSDIARPKNSSHISSACLGIQRWINRPCFEDRFIVYLPTDNAIQCRPVTSSMAIAALEYPDYLDVMADPDFDQSSPSPEKNVFHHTPHAVLSQPSNTPFQSHASSPPESSSSPTSVTPVHWRNSSTAVPSPLRIQHSPPPSTIASTKKDMPTVLTPAPISAVKRVVRFVEDDDDDGIPLHMVRMKKKREEKARFLQIEQVKRIMDGEEERKMQEQEALERERRRLAKEKEKRELDKNIYAEAIAAARIRREGHRAGTILPSNTSNHLAVSPSSTSLRNSERNKPLTDARKLSSKPPFDSSQSLSIPRRDNPDFAYYHQHSDSSPGSSRSPSISHSPVSPNHTSRPPSMYSTHTSSSEEVRQQRSSKRNSVAPPPVATVSGAPSSYRPAMVPSYPTWSDSSQALPQVPPLPDFVHDMPLLPPTAPFMKYNRSKSPGPSSTTSSRRGSFNSSNERVNQPLSPRTSTSSQHHSSTAIPPTSRTKPERRPTDERRSSGDSATLSLHSTQQRPTSSQSQPIVSRGRPALPSQYLQTPSPWPALPLQNGLMPMPMPMGYTPMNGYPVLLYPTGPMPTVQGVQLGSGGGGGGGGVGRNNNGWREPLIS